jgi:hypothetical protein
MFLHGFLDLVPHFSFTTDGLSRDSLFCSPLLGHEQQEFAHVIDLVLHIHDNWGSRQVKELEIDNVQEEQARCFLSCQGDCLILGAVAALAAACGA